MDISHNSKVGAHEARTHFAKLLDRVAAAEEIIITRRGTAIAKLVPALPNSTREQRLAVVKSMEALSRGLSLGGLKIKDLRDAGRR